MNGLKLNKKQAGLDGNKLVELWYIAAQFYLSYFRNVVKSTSKTTTYMLQKL